MLQEEDFHFCLVISQQGLCGPSSHLSLSFPNPTILHQKKKRASDKKPPILSPNPSYTGLTVRGKLAHCAPSFHFSFPLSLPGTRNLFTQTSERRPYSRDCNNQAWCNGGENTIVPCSCFAHGTKTPLSYIHFCSSAPLQNQAKHPACKNRSATASKRRNTNGHKLYTHVRMTCIQMCRHKGKCLCALFMCTLIILTAHVRAAHPFVL